MRLIGMIIIAAVSLAAHTATAKDMPNGSYTKVDVPGVINYESGTYGNHYYYHRRPSQRFCPPGHAKKGWC